MSETRTCANCGARSSPFIPRMRVGDELWCTPCASNNSFRRTTKANPQTQRMMQLIAAGWTGEDVIRHELGRQKVHNIYVNGDHAGAMCPEHLRMHRSRSDFASGLAAQVGLNHRYPTIQTSPEHEGRCDECSQVQSTQNPALPWEHRRNPGSLPPHEDRQPTPHHEGDDEGEGYQRGRWPYRPLSPNRTERHTPVVPAIQSLNMRIAVPVPQEGRPFPGIRVQAHDSGDGETIFHCPMCFAMETTFITRDGVKTFGETVGTTQYVLSADPNSREEGRWVEAKIREFGIQPLMKVTLKRNKRVQVIYATPEHRWLVKANLKIRTAPVTGRISRKGRPVGWRPPTCGQGHPWTEASTRNKKNGTRECKICAAQATVVGGISRSTDRDVLTRDLRPGQRLSYLRPSGVGNLHPDAAGIRHGVVFGDGSAQGRAATVTLWGEKDKQLLDYFPDRRYVDRRTPMGLTSSGVIGTGVPGVQVSGDLWAWMKAIPEATESDEYLYGWLTGYFAADGHVTKQGQVSISSASLENLEAVRDLALRLGISTYGITTKMRAGFPGRKPSPLHSMEFVTSTLNEGFFLIEEHRNRYRLRNYSYERIGWTVVSVEETGRMEPVYCAVVPRLHSFALEHNIWVGNCGSGQVIARSDGTVECEFCQTAFTVQIQPQMPAFPQTIDGVPVDVPGMPAGGANANVPSGDPMGDPEEEPPEDAEDESDMPAFLKGSLLLRTVQGDVLDSPQYLRHLALTHANDSNAVLAQIRDENGRG